MGARNPADRPERIDQMNVLDRNIGIVETKVDADVPDGTLSGSAPRGVRRLVLPLWRAPPGLPHRRVFSPPRRIHLSQAPPLPPPRTRVALLLPCLPPPLRRARPRR